MNQYNLLRRRYQKQPILHLDVPLLSGLFLLSLAGLFILYSAGSQNLAIISKQLTRLALAFAVMFACAQIPPHRYKSWAPWLFTAALILLIAVIVIGAISKGAQRWLSLGLFRFQPSEIMKLAVPILLAKFLNDKHLPPKFSHIVICSLFIIAPAFITAKQPDLGTALIITFAGFFVLLLSGINWKLITGVVIGLTLSIPFIWHFMHIYQRLRVLTFFNPERDPLGAGYHIIQSKIAIGSGGLVGKGWLNGTQSHLHFLPEHATDFIFAVSGEELGLIGSILLISVFLFIVGRGLYISSQAQDTFSRLLSGSLILTFFLSFFVNIGMVIGILPVVGLPLPLISYGGTSMVTLMAGFGIIMSIQTHRKLVTS